MYTIDMSLSFIGYLFSLKLCVSSTTMSNGKHIKCHMPCILFNEIKHEWKYPWTYF